LELQAKARIVDVGGLKGKHELVFVRGKLNVVEGSNSGGKSSVIQALTAALSMPLDCDMSPFYSNEAIRLGVKTDPSNTQEGFVHVLAKSGQVELIFNESRFEYMVDSRGSPQRCPNGDPRFLLAGVLSNRSKVIRQLRGQDARHEPDDFKWAVTELSLAKRYEEVLSILKEGRDEALTVHQTASRKARENVTLSKRKSALEKKCKSLNRDIGKLKDQYKNVSDVLSKIEKVRQKRSELSERMTRENAELKALKAKGSRERKRAEKLRKESESKRADHDAIDLEKLKKSMEKRRNEVHQEVTDLMRKRDALDGILNLFVVAESGMDKEGAKCPLCGKGHLTYSEVNAKVTDLRRQKDELNGQIGRLNMTVQQQKRELDKKIEEKQESLEEHQDLLAQAKTIETDLHQKKSRESLLEGNLKDHTKKIGSIDQQIKQLSEKVGVGSQKAEQAYTKRENEYRKVSDELAVVTQKLYETTMDIGIRSLPPDVAVAVTDRWLSFYDSLIEFTSGVAENQRRQAAEQFNASVKGLLERLDFKEFRTVMLNQDYRLYIERFDEKKKEYVFQQVRTLSTSEQMSIALILQMALKETYLPEVPFFLIDDAMEDFDDDRRIEVMAYLQEKAKKNDLFLISTKLVKGLDKLHVV
jgi:DNA repair exonuclease SbcCD ATPase subunit